MESRDGKGGKGYERSLNMGVSGRAGGSEGSGVRERGKQVRERHGRSGRKR